jgi:hypothetical protein
MGGGEDFPGRVWQPLPGAMANIAKTCARTHNGKKDSHDEYECLAD